MKSAGRSCNTLFFSSSVAGTFAMRSAATPSPLAKAYWGGRSPVAVPLVQNVCFRAHTVTPLRMELFVSSADVPFVRGVRTGAPRYSPTAIWVVRSSIAAGDGANRSFAGCIVCLANSGAIPYNVGGNLPSRLQSKRRTKPEIRTRGAENENEIRPHQTQKPPLA